jgi:hypothetical protein
MRPLRLARRTTPSKPITDKPSLHGQIASLAFVNEQPVGKEFQRQLYRLCLAGVHGFSILLHPRGILDTGHMQPFR